MTMENSSSHRIAHFDLLKGIAIFLVVMGHVLTMCVRDIDAAFLFKLIGQVHMPVFFFISGYFTYKAVYASPDLKKRFLQLIVPFFTVSALWVLYFPHSGLKSPLSDNLPDLYRAYWKDGYWFGLCLMEIIAVYALISPVLRRCRKTAASVTVGAVAYSALLVAAHFFSHPEENTDYLSLGLTARFFPIFMAGVLCHKHKDAFNRLWRNQWAITISMIVFAATFYCTVYPWDVAWLPEWSGIVVVPLMHMALMVIAFAAIHPWAQSEFASQKKPSAAARWFNHLGKESLGIYMCHFFFLFPLTALQEPMRAMGLGFTPLFVVAAFTAFAIIAVVLVVIHILKQSAVLNLLILGGGLPSRRKME